MPNRFLFDENLSYQSAEFLAGLGYNTTTTFALNLDHRLDEDIAAIAGKKNFIIVTLDTDFAELYYYTTEQKMGAIILKLDNQTIESVNQTLLRLHKTNLLTKPALKRSLLIVDKNKIRLRQ